MFLSLINVVLSIFKRQNHKTYDYTHYIVGRDYVFEPTNNETQGYMTGQDRGIKCGDYILLYRNSQLERYQVEEIDYYLEPPDMWIALLKKIVG
ncbi:MAG: hypothetical protein QNJ47_19640 [Nostocaceae cyanobacterium]|nr:hypothetical protein [Nostocaceae cyanobacterium]